jgi:phospholipase/carboxylesterase
MCHGAWDPLVPVATGREARDALVAHGYSVEWHEFPMQHEVCGEEIALVARWLRERLAA